MLCDRTLGQKARAEEYQSRGATLHNGQQLSEELEVSQVPDVQQIPDIRLDARDGADGWPDHQVPQRVDNNEFSIGARNVARTGDYLTDSSHPSWDVLPDGRFLMMKRAAAGPKTVVVHNGGRELREKTAAKR